MRVLCLQFPNLAIHLARKSRPHLAGRPIVLIDGTGADATVTAASQEALAKGVRPGTRSDVARAACASAMFLPDNASACLDELERIASIVRKYATISVAIESPAHLVADLSGSANEERDAARLLSVARQWSGTAVRAGLASTRTGALEAARAARSSVAIAPAVDAAHEPAVRDHAGPLSAMVTLRGPSMAPAAAALRRLHTVQEAMGRGCRELRLRATIGEETRSLTIRFDGPTLANDAAPRVLAAVQRLERGGQDVRLRVELQRLAPLPVPAWRVALAAAG